MSRGLHMLGASTGLSSQYVVARVTDIDAAKLKAALGSSRGALAGLVLAIADETPKALLDIALPFAAKTLKSDYGIEATLATSNVGPPERGMSEFFPGTVAGIGIGGIGVVIWVAGGAVAGGIYIGAVGLGIAIWRLAGRTK